MMQNLYVVWDNRAEGLVGLPFVNRNDMAAIRTFADAFKNPQSGLSAHPADFDLYSLGQLADGSPVITSDTRHVVNGSTIVAASSEPEATDK